LSQCQESPPRDLTVILQHLIYNQAGDVALSYALRQGEVTLTRTYNVADQVLASDWFGYFFLLFSLMLILVGAISQIASPFRTVSGLTFS